MDASISRFAGTIRNSLSISSVGTFRSLFPEASEISHRLVPEFTSLRHKSSAGRKFQPYESRLLSARDFARTIGTGGIEIVESDSIHRTCATVVNRQAFGKLRSQTYSKFSSCFSFRASVYVTVPQIPNLSCPATIF